MVVLRTNLKLSPNGVVGGVGGCVVERSTMSLQVWFGFLSVLKFNEKQGLVEETWVLL